VGATDGSTALVIHWTTATQVGTIRSMRVFHVYIMASNTCTLYTGVTGDLKQRVFLHKTRRADGFTARYNVTRLVYVEAFRTAEAAIEREKQIKAWRREKKIALIEQHNPAWSDLAQGWFPADTPIAQQGP